MTLFVLRKIKYGESDLILHGLTATGAKIHLIAKGAVKSRKRFGGGILEPTHCLSVTYKERHGREDQLQVLEEATLLEDFHGLRSSYDRLEAAFVLLELVGKLAQEGDEHSKNLFDLLGNTLRALQTTDNVQMLLLHFEIKVLAQQGVLPPDLPQLEFFRLPIRDHATIELPACEFQELRSRVVYHIKDYLQNRC
jgi:DNA repair protein RecO (recombination protein O)